MSEQVKPCPFVYIASPYSHGNPATREHRFRAACRYAAKLMLKGVVVFSPIAHSHPVCEIGMDGANVVDHEFWMRQDKALLMAASDLHVLMMDGWQASRGVAQEIAWAAELGIPVTYVEHK